MRDERRSGRGLRRSAAAVVAMAGMMAAHQGLAQTSSTQEKQQQAEERQQQQQQKPEERQQRATRIVIDPEALVRVGYDYDGDGVFDYYEYIFAYDIEEARKSTQARIGQRGGESERMARQSGRSEGQRPMQTIEGTLKELTAMSIAGVDESHMVARVETDTGRTARVNLGPADQLAQLNLKEGDEVTLMGRRGTVDEKGMFMAHRVETDGESVAIRRTHDLNLRRLSGEILETRTGKFREERAPDHLLARIRLEDGATTIVNLGPKDQLPQMDLTGKQVHLLAHPARVAGKQALVAEQIRVDDRTIDIDWTSPRGGGN